MQNGILEPGKFRGEETLVKSILELSVPSKMKKLFTSRGHGEASPKIQIRGKETPSLEV